MVRCAVTSAARFAIRMTHMLTLDKPNNADKLFDERALVADLAKLADEHAGAEQELRRAVAQRLKAVLATGRAQAEQLLLKDRQGRRCAERLCFMMDEIIRVLFEFVDHASLSIGKPVRSPSAWRSWRPAATAAACWRPAPTSICCSCCPTSRPRGASRSPRRSSIACGISD